MGTSIQTGPGRPFRASHRARSISKRVSSGSRIWVTCLQTGAAIATMSTSWSPSWRRGRSYEVTSVSLLTCPETTIMGIEST